MLNKNKPRRPISAKSTFYDLSTDDQANIFDDKGRLWLPENLGARYLTKKEVSVLQLIVRGKTSKRIAKLLGCSHRTIEEYTEKIKRKLHCSYKHEIHATVIEYGIIFFL